MTGITERNSKQLAVCSLNLQDGYAMVTGPFHLCARPDLVLLIVAPVDGKSGEAGTRRQDCRDQFFQRATDRVDDLLLEKLRVSLNLGSFAGITLQAVQVLATLVHSGARMGIASL